MFSAEETAKMMLEAWWTARADSNICSPITLTEAFCILNAIKTKIIEDARKGDHVRIKSEQDQKVLDAVLISAFSS